MHQLHLELVANWERCRDSLFFSFPLCEFFSGFKHGTGNTEPQDDKLPRGIKERWRKLGSPKVVPGPEGKRGGGYIGVQRNSS